VSAGAATGAERVDALLAARVEANERFFAAEADRLTQACRAMSERFAAGGRLLAFAATPVDQSDARHIAVEFVHPVIVGKRALPAFSLANDMPTVTGVAARDGLAEVFAHQLRYLGDPRDIALGVSADGHSDNVLRGLEVAHDAGMLTIALSGGDGGKIAASPAVDHAFAVGSDDPVVVKEVQVTTYHILWELVHVFFEQPGLLDPGVVR
jgi:D-sedoheptulose 7-phosphate isomerase